MKTLKITVLVFLLLVFMFTIRRGYQKDNRPIVKHVTAPTIEAAPVAKAVATGGHHVIALLSDGSVWKWGGGIYNEVGFSSAIPSAVSGLKDVTALSAGTTFNIALKKDGTVSAWGFNADGELGNGNTNNSDTPVPVTGLTDIIAISSGEKHTVTLKNDGTVWTWGDNGFGQMGNGKKSHYENPAALLDPAGAPYKDAIAVAAGGGHSLMLRKDGTVWAWGNNTFGQLGDGTTEERYAPVQVLGLNDVVAIACGYAHSIAIKSDGTVWTWGNDSQGQLGEGTEFRVKVKTADPAPGTVGSSMPVETRKPYREIPVRVIGLTDVISVFGGREYTLALKKDGTVWAWGDNAFGQLGNPGVQRSPVPLKVQEMTDGKSIAAGDDFGVVIREDGTVWTWGYNIRGQLGDGTKSHSSLPIRASVTARKNTHAGSGKKEPVVPFPSNIVSVAAGGYHSLALSSDGTVWTWGNNAQGQLGNGTTENSNKPVRLTWFDKVTVIAAGYAHSLALRQDGTVWAWGDNEYGQLGDGTTTFSAVPVRVKGLTNVRAISAGGYHSVALKQDGSVWAWGDNEYGQLGNGTNDNSPVPRRVKDISHVASVAAGGFHTVVARTDNTIWTWGGNRYGQLGDGTTSDRALPVQVRGLDASQPVICAGARHSAALRTWNGKVWTWGANEFGQLGDGSRENQAAPVLVQVPIRGLTDFSDKFLSGIIALSCGGDHTIALMNGGGLYAWGRGTYGQIGRSGRMWKDSFLAEGSPTGNLGAVASGYEHNVGLAKDGTVWTWGSNEYGQLGVPGAYDSINSMQVK